MYRGVVQDAVAAPPAEVGARLLALPEDQYLERKALNVSPERLANLEVAFANAEGGLAVVGLRDGRVEGTHRDTARVNALVQAAYDLTVPVVPHRVQRLDCVNDDGQTDELLLIWVEPSGQVHANHRDEVFLRVGDETRRLGFDQRRELVFDKGQSAFEAEPVRGSSFDHVEAAEADEYARAVGHPDPERLLAARGLLVGTELTVAGALLFAEHPQRWLPQAQVRVLRYHGNDRGSGRRQQLVDDVRCEGPLRAQVAAARHAVSRLQPTRKALGRSGRFERMPLVPEDAWLEGVVNAVVHRSYSISGDYVRVEIFDDRIEINSPGRFPGLVAINDPLNAHHFARNPRIARAMADLDLGQEIGEGIRRMFAEMRAANLTDPMYHQTSGSVSLVLSAELRNVALDAGLPREAQAVMAALREAERLSTGEIAALLGLSRPPALRRLAALEEAGVIEWVGQSKRDPRAYWRLVR